MEDLVVVVYLMKYNHLITIPTKCIYKLRLAKAVNNCVNRNQTHLIFFSDDIHSQPNFHLPLLTKIRSKL